MYGHVITKFSRMGRFTYSWCCATRARAPLLTLLAKVESNNEALDKNQLQYLEKNVLKVKILPRPVNVVCFIQI